jgi:chromate transporter
MTKLGQLFISFFKIGLFTFGGGYAMLPLLQAETVKRRGWLTEDELLDYFSIGQCTPGIIAVNVSTFCGYKIRGIIGAFTATCAIVLPSLIIITLIAAVLNRFIDNPLVSGAFSGIRLGVTALLLNMVIDTGLTLWRTDTQKCLHTGIFLLSVLLLFGLGFSAVSVVVTAACCGFVPYFLRRKNHD